MLYTGAPHCAPSNPHLRAWAEAARMFEQFFAATATMRPSLASVSFFAVDHMIVSNGSENEEAASRLLPACCQLRLHLSGFYSTEPVSNLSSRF
jgi:hypothetical protein